MPLIPRQTGNWDFSPLASNVMLHYIGCQYHEWKNWGKCCLFKQQSKHDSLHSYSVFSSSMIQKCFAHWGSEKHFIYSGLISLTSAVEGKDNLFLLISHVACKGPLEVSGPTSCSEQVQSQQVAWSYVHYTANLLLKNSKHTKSVFEIVDHSSYSFSITSDNLMKNI